MNKFITHSTGLALTFILASCSLIEPTNVENPNVGEDTYLASDRAMDIWVNGAEKTFATTIAKFCLHTEIISHFHIGQDTCQSCKHRVERVQPPEPYSSFGRSRSHYCRGTVARCRSYRWT